MNRLSRCAVAVVVAAGLVSGCTGDDGDGPSTARSSSAGSNAAGPSASASVNPQQYLDAPADPAVAGADGKLPDINPGASVPARLDVIAVEAGARSTLLRWRLSSTQEGATPQPQALTREKRSPDTSAVVLIADQADLRLQPGTWRSRNLAIAPQCSCSFMPLTLGAKGIDLSSTYAALPADVTQVVVKAPGFAGVTVPVTRS